MDDNTHQERIISSPEIKDIAPGRSISLSLVDGTQLTGIFLGIGTMADSEYAARLDEFSCRGDKQVSLPIPGDTVTLIAYNGESTSLIFVGFADSSLVMRPLVDTATVNILPMHIKLTIDSHNSVITGENYAAILAGPPRLGTVIIDVSGQRIEIPEQDIKQVKVPARDRFLKTGIMFGLFFDVIYLSMWYLAIAGMARAE